MLCLYVRNGSRQFEGRIDHDGNRIITTRYRWAFPTSGLMMIKESTDVIDRADEACLSCEVRG